MQCSAAHCSWSCIASQIQGRAEQECCSTQLARSPFCSTCGHLPCRTWSTSTSIISGGPGLRSCIGANWSSSSGACIEGIAAVEH
eukprot:9252191-Heterocapsa_arctica.AAC.1